ncbi:MAG: hypothetical protein M9908_09505 [Phyllobacteriaceae bacterium]|nr:hypothetical protein [Phyllobacteriaceae bacterium]
MAKPVEHEPSGFLRNLDILGKCGAGDAFLWLVISQIAMNHLRSGILESSDRTDLDGELLAAIVALVGFLSEKCMTRVEPPVRAVTFSLPSPQRIDRR